MSAASAEHPKGVEASAAPKAVDNTMHFNNGGVAGVVESFAKLLKGVTYDAAKETMADSKAATSPEHPKAADPKADHPKVAEAEAKEAAPAATAGHEDNDWVDDVAHWATIYAHLPFAEKGIKWLKGKLFPEIHEIAVDDQHIGDQILHKLKKDKKAERKGKLALDHHALEGFLKGLDIANLNRTLRMFTDKKRFETALEREGGQEEIKKEIANLLDLSGEADFDEVVKSLDMLAQLLGEEWELKADEYQCKSQKGHHIDSRVAKQHHALIHILEHARNWLTGKNLAKIYDTEVKNFKIDFEHFGDLLIEEVNPGNRDRYLR